MRADGIEPGMRYGTDYIIVDGDVILRATTRAEAGEQLSKRATELLLEGRFTTLRQAFAEAMRERAYLKRIYVEG